MESPQEVKYSQQLRDGGMVAMDIQHKQEHLMEHQDSGMSATPSYKSLSPLVTQEFPIPKPGGKVIPRYTVHKFNVKSPGRSSFTLPANALSSSSSSAYSQPSSYLHGQHTSHLVGSSDDITVHSDRMSTIVLGRRSSLPQQFLSGQSGSCSDSKLSTLAEHCQSSSSADLFPPSYAAIKQALLCDQYNKRRQSVQSDPKTLKNLLKTKLVISEDSNDLVNMRRKSDPGSYVKQRDFERRKELFLDENLSWAKSYGKVINQQISRWQQKRQEKQLQREMLNWQAQAAASASLSQLQLQMLNPLMAGQSVQFGDGGLVTVNTAAAAAASSLFPGNLTSGGMVSPYIFPQAVFPNTVGTATASPPIYYNPYALINPYAAASLQQLGQVQAAAPTAGTFFVPGAALSAAAATQPKVLYYVPQPATTNSSSPLSTSSTTPNPYSSFPISTTSPSMVSTDSLLNGAGDAVPPASTSSPPRISLIAPPTYQTTTTWLTDNTQFGTDLHKLQPVSPNNRKRHQSVPEKLTSLLQPPLPPSIPSAPLSTSSLSSGRSSPMDEGMDGNPDSPPLSKKQRSTSDTTVYHSSYRLHQLSPARGRSPTPHSQGSSPQPPHGTTTGATSLGAAGAPSLLEGSLSPLQAHLLQVHQSYGISRSAVEERKRRHNIPRDKRGHSPLRKVSGGSMSNGRKHSGGSLNNGSMSPTSSLIEELPIMEGVSNSLGGPLQEGKRDVMSDMEEREAGSETGSEQGEGV